jgi:hypothetical protein
MGMVKVSPLVGETRECNTEELLRLAHERDARGIAWLELSRTGSQYPMLTVFLKDRLAVALRIDEDPLRPGGDADGTEVFVTAGDGTAPAAQHVDFLGPGGPETLAGEMIVSDARAMAILQAFGDDLEWPSGIAWITQL